MQKLPDQRCAVCEGSNYLYVAALLIGHAVFALFLDFKSRQIHVHEDGAALGILTFFLQSLALFADKEGDNALYGLARLSNLEIVTAGETEAGTPECRLDIGPFGSWYISVIWTPLYLFICSLLVFFIQERRVSHLGHIGLVRETETQAAGIGDIPTHEGGGTLWHFVAKLWNRYSAATQLNFLRLKVLSRNDNAVTSQSGGDSEGGKTSEMDALRRWWLLSCIILKKKMLGKQRQRMALELSMFVYMGLAKGGIKMIPGLTACQRIDGQWWSSLDTSIKCSDTYPTQVVSTFVLLLFTAGFPLYIIWRLQGGAGGMGTLGDEDEMVGSGIKAGRFTTM